MILPVYNAEDTLTSAVDSILRQSFQQFELLIVNDGSTDRSRDILAGYRDPRIRIIDCHVNRGLVAALNDALQEARADLIARQDADDISLPKRFELQRAMLEAEPNLGAVGAALQTVWANGSAAGTWKYPESATIARWQSLFKTPVAHSAVMFRRGRVLEVGGYLKEFKYAEDYDLWSRLLKVADIRSISHPLVKYALGPQGVSRARAREQMAVQCRIAARNMREVLGADVPDEVVQTLAIGIDLQEGTIEYEQFVKAASTCTILVKAFMKSQIERTERAALLYDYRGKLFKLTRMLPYRSRVPAIKEIISMAPKGALGRVTGAIEGIRCLMPFG